MSDKTTSKQESIESIPQKNILTAEDYGFLPGNTADENSEALQKAVDRQGTVLINLPGTYLLNKTIEIGDDTTIIFGAGVYIKRMPLTPDEKNSGYAFINKGAYERKYNTNIKIIGLKLICNGVEPKIGRYIIGVRGHVCFFYIKNLVISDFQCYDLQASGFGIHICTFENVIVENCRIEGDKDGVHFGTGSKFVVRHCIFRTFDDPIALNAHDYTNCNPELGWIEDGLIEDCYELDQDSTVGFFCRLLGGSWVDWFSGMEVQHSDTVISCGRLYRVNMSPDGKIFSSLTKPEHTNGTETLDGIDWVMVQNNAIYNCGCKNIHFRNIRLKKKRPIAFSFSFEKDRFCRSYYPNSNAPLQKNITFENVTVENDIDYFVYAHTPVDILRILNCDIKDSTVRLESRETEGLSYTDTKILIQGSSFNTSTTRELIGCANDRTASLNMSSNFLEDKDNCVLLSENIKIGNIDMKYRKS